MHTYSAYTYIESVCKYIYVCMWNIRELCEVCVCGYGWVWRERECVCVCLVRAAAKTRQATHIPIRDLSRERVFHLYDYHLIL